MSSASMSFGSNMRYGAPRGALWAGKAMAALMRAIQRADGWLLAQRRDEPRTLQEVLDLARRVERSEPGFAADLRAAALRSQGKD